MPCDDHLRHALTVVDGEGLLREVDEQHAHLAAVVCIDGAGAVQHGDAMLQGQSAAWPHLGLVARRQGHV